MPRLRPLPTVFLLGLCALGAVVLHHWHVLDRALLGYREWRSSESVRDRNLWLPDYRVEIEAKSIDGLDQELSALAFDPVRRTLYSVTNRNPELIELSLQGKLLRRIPLQGFGDPEAVEYIAPGILVITDERLQRLVKVRIDEHTDLLRAEDFQQLSLAIGLNGNKGFEGLAYDSSEKRLFVAKERDPLRIFEVRGFPHEDTGKPLAVEVLSDPQRDRELFVHDLSSLDFDSGSGNLLALSDESRLLLELDHSGRPISSLSLRGGGRSGLKRSVPQAEGVATDDMGNIYLVSEPNLFYLFRKIVVAQ
ncbi:SdiA-regulated domain-containing protein [Pseudomonas mangrovi]|uniref:DNA-binding protein n=1 Tax=Pseudomonas mangrovi TaxID=2161748 RepID=A0A2T5P5P7_9PSED|nr:SdiA-regulated domain-containing protein [Pseudomonas mangrovi]PTU73034.1 DNA-binding protein [Pseudomonas mangrovi]